MRSYRWGRGETRARLLPQTLYTKPFPNILSEEKQMRYTTIEVPGTFADLLAVANRDYPSAEIVSAQCFYSALHGKLATSAIVRFDRDDPPAENGRIAELQQQLRTANAALRMARDNRDADGRESERRIIQLEKENADLKKSQFNGLVPSVFGWWDKFNSEFVSLPEDATYRRHRGNKLIPLYTVD